MCPRLFIVARKGSGDVGGVDGWGVPMVVGAGKWHFVWLLGHEFWGCIRGWQIVKRSETGSYVAMNNTNWSLETSSEDFHSQLILVGYFSWVCTLKVWDPFNSFSLVFVLFSQLHS